MQDAVPGAWEAADNKADPVPVPVTSQPFCHLAYTENACSCFKTQYFRPAPEASVVIYES